MHSLPDWISNLTSLRIIDLTNSKVSVLPFSMEKLVNLRVLYLDRTPIMNSTTPNPVLSNTVRRCPLLGCVGCNRRDAERKPEYQNLVYTMMRNRARSRVVFRNNFGRTRDFCSVRRFLVCRIYDNHKARAAEYSENK